MICHFKKSPHGGRCGRQIDNDPFSSFGGSFWGFKGFGRTFRRSQCPDGPGGCISIGQSMSCLSIQCLFQRDTVNNWHLVNWRLVHLHCLSAGWRCFLSWWRGCSLIVTKRCLLSWRCCSNCTGPIYIRSLRGTITPSETVILLISVVHGQIVDIH